MNNWEFNKTTLSEVNLLNRIHLFNLYKVIYDLVVISGNTHNKTHFGMDYQVYTLYH